MREAAGSIGKSLGLQSESGRRMASFLDTTTQTGEETQAAVLRVDEAAQNLREQATALRDLVVAFQL